MLFWHTGMRDGNVACAIIIFPRCSKRHYFHDSSIIGEPYYVKESYTGPLSRVYFKTDSHTS